MSISKALFSKKPVGTKRLPSTKKLLPGFIVTQALLQRSDKNNRPFRWNSYLSYSLALARTSLGVVAYLTPSVPSVPWVGKEEASRNSIRLFARTLGARDFALGMGHLYSLVKNEDSKKWLLSGATADLGDTVATILAFKKLPKPYAYGVLALTVSACVLGVYLALTEQGTLSELHTP